MADVVVTILTPTLTGSDYFKTRYRLLPAGAYTANVNRTNAPFTLASLAVGDYEMEIIFVDVEGATETECPAVIHEFSVDPEFTCFPFDAEIVQNGALYELVVTYTLPSPLSWPPCGFDITWNQNGTNNTIHYATLPLSGEIRYTIPTNANTSLTVLADMCGYYNVCFEESVPKIPSPNCTPAVLTGYDLVFTPPPVGAVVGTPGTWNARAFGINSNPATPIYNFSYQELSLVPPGYVPDSGNFSFPGGLPLGNFLYTIPQPGTLNPKGVFLYITGGFPSELIPNCIIYRISFVDYCNVRHTFCVSGMWTPPPAGSNPTQNSFDNDVNCGC